MQFLARSFATILALSVSVHFSWKQMVVLVKKIPQQCVIGIIFHIPIKISLSPIYSRDSVVTHLMQKKASMRPLKHAHRLLILLYSLNYVDSWEELDPIRYISFSEFCCDTLWRIWKKRRTKANNKNTIIRLWTWSVLWPALNTRRVSIHMSPGGNTLNPVYGLAVICHQVHC